MPKKTRTDKANAAYANHADDIAAMADVEADRIMRQHAYVWDLRTTVGGSVHLAR